MPVLENTNMLGPRMGRPLIACQGGSVGFLHGNSASLSRNTGLQEAQNRQKQTCFWFWSRCAGGGEGERGVEERRQVASGGRADAAAFGGDDDETAPSAAARWESRRMPALLRRGHRLNRHRRRLFVQ